MNKYHRAIRDLYNPDEYCIDIDVYSVLEAFDVRCPARQHAIKKLLCAGIRGKGDTLQDLQEAAQAVDRAVEMERGRRDGTE